MSENSIRVIFDTNIWISFLIGKKLVSMKDHITSGKLVIILSPQLIEEIKLVTARPKLKKYFPKKAVRELIELLEIVGEKFDPPSKHSICRDAKDNFLLDLIEGSKADYLVTGDKDLLELNPFNNAQIITASGFEEILKDGTN